MEELTTKIKVTKKIKKVIKSSDNDTVDNDSKNIKIKKKVKISSVENFEKQEESQNTDHQEKIKNYENTKSKEADNPMTKYDESYQNGFSADSIKNRETTNDLNKYLDTDLSTELPPNTDNNSDGVDKLKKSKKKVNREIHPKEENNNDNNMIECNGNGEKKVKLKIKKKKCIDYSIQNENEDNSKFDKDDNNLDCDKEIKVKNKKKIKSSQPSNVDSLENMEKKEIAKTENDLTDGLDINSYTESNSFVDIKDTSIPNKRPDSDNINSKDPLDNFRIDNNSIGDCLMLNNNYNNNNNNNNNNINKNEMNKQDEDMQNGLFIHNRNEEEIATFEISDELYEILKHKTNIDDASSIKTNDNRDAKEVNLKYPVVSKSEEFRDNDDQKKFRDENDPGNTFTKTNHASNISPKEDSNLNDSFSNNENNLNKTNTNLNNLIEEIVSTSDLDKDHQKFNDGKFLKNSDNEKLNFDMEGSTLISNDDHDDYSQTKITDDYINNLFKRLNINNNFFDYDDEKTIKSIERDSLIGDNEQIPDPSLNESKYKAKDNSIFNSKNDDDYLIYSINNDATNYTKSNSIENEKYSMNHEKFLDTNHSIPKYLDLNANDSESYSNDKEFETSTRYSSDFAYADKKHSSKKDNATSDNIDKANNSYISELDMIKAKYNRKNKNIPLSDASYNSNNILKENDGESDKNKIFTNGSLKHDNYFNNLNSEYFNIFEQKKTSSAVKNNYESDLFNGIKNGNTDGYYDFNSNQPLDDLNEGFSLDQEGFVAKFRKERTSQKRSNKNSFIARGYIENDEQLRDKKRQAQNLADLQSNLVESLQTMSKELNDIEKSLKDVIMSSIDQKTNSENSEAVIDSVFHQYEKEIEEADESLKQQKQPKSYDLKKDLSDLMNTVMIYTREYNYKNLNSEDGQSKRSSLYSNDSNQCSTKFLKNNTIDQIYNSCSNQVSPYFEGKSLSRRSSISNNNLFTNSKFSNSSHDDDISMIIGSKKNIKQEINLEQNASKNILSNANKFVNNESKENSSIDDFINRIKQKYLFPTSDSKSNKLENMPFYSKDSKSNKLRNIPLYSKYDKFSLPNSSIETNYSSNSKYEPKSNFDFKTPAGYKSNIAFEYESIKNIGLNYKTEPKFKNTIENKISANAGNNSKYMSDPKEIIESKYSYKSRTTSLPRKYADLSHYDQSGYDSKFSGSSNSSKFKSFNKNTNDNIKNNSIGRLDDDETTKYSLNKKIDDERINMHQNNQNNDRLNMENTNNLKKSDTNSEIEQQFQSKFILSSRAV